MPTVEKSIELGVPAQVAYNQWTQFEEFPKFMSHVEQVRQLDDRRLLWRARIGPKVEEWEAEISEQIPDKRIAWHSAGGATHAGVVTFHRLDDRHSRVMLQMKYEPEGVVEKTGELLGMLDRRVGQDLEDFKTFVESHGSASGAWRGEIPSRG